MMEGCSCDPWQKVSIPRKEALMQRNIRGYECHIVDPAYTWSLAEDHGFGMTFGVVYYWPPDVWLVEDQGAIYRMDPEEMLRIYGDTLLPEAEANIRHLIASDDAS
jgi:hypothetical protein